MWVSSLHLSLPSIPNLEMVFASSKLVWWEYKSPLQRGRMLSISSATADTSLWQQLPGHFELSSCQKLLLPRPLSTAVSPALSSTFQSLPVVHIQHQWHCKLTSVALHSTEPAP